MSCSASCRLLLLLALSATTTTQTAVALSVSCRSSSRPEVGSIQHLEAGEPWDVAEYYAAGPKPLLITRALSKAECEMCAESLVSMQETTAVELQEQKQGATVQIYDTSLQDALDAILFESSAASVDSSSYLAFCEGLLQQLDDATSALLQEMTNRARDRMWQEDDTDWFASYFPPTVRPTDAVVFAGIGATSTLHRDPFEWMGTSLCLEGSKLWRFVDPTNSSVQDIDELLESYRLPSIAWGEESSSTSFSAGWQSDKSLFRLRCPERMPTAESLDATDDASKRKLFEEIVFSNDVVSRDDSIPPATTVSTVIQHTGDLLLIPPHWWHQTIALEPSAAIASQRCGSYDAPLVLQHMLDWCQVPRAEHPDTIMEHLPPPPPPQPTVVVDKVLALCAAAMKTTPGSSNCKPRARN